MKKTLLLLLGLAVLATSGAQVYTTVQPGNWSDPSTWSGNQVPPTELLATHTVYINHSVVYNRGDDLKLHGRLEIIGGALRFPNDGSTGSNRSIFVYSTGYFRIFGGELIMPVKKPDGSNTSGNFIVEGGHIVMINSKVEISQNLSALVGSRRLIMGTCLRLGENYENQFATDTLQSVCIETGLHGSSNFSNDGGIIRMNSVSIFMKGTSGNFQNKKVDTSRILTYLNPAYAITALKVVGNLENESVWQASINKYCVGQNITDKPFKNLAQNELDLPPAEDCPYFDTYTCDCSAAAIILPVELKSFTVTRKGPEILAKWETTTESNNQGFYLQRNTKGAWIEIAFITSSAIGGNSSALLRYTFTDINTHKGVSLYRLRQLDRDGKQTFSSIRAVQGLEQASKTIIYPNPSSTGSFSIVFNNERPKNVTVSDMKGSLVRKFRNVINSLSIVGLGTGVYSIEIVDLSSSEKLVERLVVNK
jgi:hypothetical protein